jgi:hypothetical protein
MKARHSISRSEFRLTVEAYLLVYRQTVAESKKAI